MYGKARRFVLRTDDDGFLDCDGCLFGIFCRYEEMEQKRLADLVQSFADRMIDVSKRGAKGGRHGSHEGLTSVGLVPHTSNTTVWRAAFAMASFAYWGTR